MFEGQLEWVRHVQEALRSPWLDGFFKVWDLVDTVYFSIIVISLIWYLWDRRIGIRLFYILIISLAVNKILKGIFDLPRPCQVDPLVGIICSRSPGFPSGAAQTATILAGLVFIECKQTLYRGLALVFAFLLCFSRVYLGLHYPIDILGGVAVGLLLLLIYSKGFPLMEKYWKILAVLFPFFLWLLGELFPLPHAWIVYIFFATLGVAAGLICYDKMKVRKIKNLRLRACQVCSVIGGLAILFAMERVLPSLELLWNFGEGFWLSFLGGWVVEISFPRAQ